MTHADAGTSTCAPAAAITPFRINTVPFSITGPLTGTIRAPRIAVQFTVSASAAGIQTAIPSHAAAKAAKEFLLIANSRILNWWFPNANPKIHPLR